MLSALESQMYYGHKQPWLARYGLKYIATYFWDLAEVSQVYVATLLNYEWPFLKPFKHKELWEWQIPSTIQQKAGLDSKQA